MDHTIKVSVIMPTYNRAPIIPRSIRSVLRQSCSDFELIVIDDASTDNTAEVVQGFNDSRIHYIQRSANHLEQFHRQGIIDNPRNDGLKAARGQYIAYLDSDDIYRPNFIETLSRYLDRRPDVHFVYGDAIWYRNLDGKGEVANCNMSVDFGREIMKHRNIIRTPTIMHRREIIDRIGYFKPIKVRCPHKGVPYVGIEDWDYWYRVSQVFTIRHHPVIVAHKVNESSRFYTDPDFDPEAGSRVAPEGEDLIYRMDIIRDFNKLSDKFEAVGGWLHPAEGYALMNLAAHGAGSGEIVEIGSFLGRSTCWLAYGSKTAGREKVTAVDHFKGSPEHQPGKRHQCKALIKEGTTYNRFLKNIRSMDVEDHVRPVIADSVEAAGDWTGPIRLLFIDGNHSYEGSQRDFEAWSGFLISGGYAGFHDIDQWPGVTGYYNHLMTENREYEEVLAINSLRIIRKR